MSREIKFRALSISDGEWKHGHLCWNTDFNTVIRDERGQDWTCKPGTEGQYTGLKDRNGREIYEGDVIESHDSGGSPIRHVIEFDASEGRFAACYLFNGHKDYPGSMRQAWLNEYAKAVIGNVHENPELLS